MDELEKDLWARVKSLSARRGVPFTPERFQPDVVSSAGVPIRLWIVEAGARQPTVVFMPGTNAYSLLYGEFLLALANRGFNVVAFDPRGHGISGGRPGNYTIPELMGDMDTAVSYARGRFSGPVAVAGSSQGGITAFYYAAGHSPAAAVCHNLADLADPDSVCLTRWPRLSRFFKPLAPRLARYAPEMRIPLDLYLDLSVEPLRGVGSVKEAMLEDPFIAPFITARAMASLASEPLPVPVERIKTPVLVLHGAGDSIFPRDYVEGIYRRLTGNKALCLYEDLPHYLLMDHVARVIGDVAEWLDKVFGVRSL